MIIKDLNAVHLLENININNSQRSSFENYSFEKQTPDNSKKDLRRLVLDKIRGQESPIQKEYQYSDQSSKFQVNITAVDYLNSPKYNSQLYSQSRNQVKLQQIKQILLSNDQIQLENPTHNEILLHVIKKPIRNKEEINFIQLFLKGLSILNIKNDFTSSEETDLSQSIYPFISYSFFSKGETIYNSVHNQIGIIFIKGKVAQYNDDNSDSKKQQRDQNYLRAQKLSKTSKLDDLFHNKNLQDDQNKNWDDEKINIPNKSLEKYYEIGQGFGDIEIITNQTRSSTMICLQDTHLLTISKQGFEQVFIKYIQTQHTEKIAYFKQFCFFKYIPDSRILNFINSAKKIKYINKQIIYQEGDPVDMIYFIINGEVSISKICDKKRINIKILGSNNFFGIDEISNQISPSKVREIKVISSSNDLNVLAFNLQKFMKFLMSYKQLDTFIEECKKKLQTRDQIAEKICTTQNFIEIELSHRRPIEQPFDIKQGMLQKLMVHRKQQSLKQASSELTEQSQQIHINQANKLEQIVNAREKIFNTLDQQQQQKEILNKRKISSDSILQAQANNMCTLNQKKKNYIFAQQKDLIFDQSYFNSQEKINGKNNKYMLELKQIINSQNPEKIRNQKQSLIFDTLQSKSAQNIIIDQIDNLQSRVNNNQIQSSIQISPSTKFLKQYLSKKRLEKKYKNFEIENHQKNQNLTSCDDLTNQRGSSKDSNKIQQVNSTKFIDRQSLSHLSDINKTYDTLKTRKKQSNFNIGKIFEQQPSQQVYDQNKNSSINNFQALSLSHQCISIDHLENKKDKESPSIILDTLQSNTSQLGIREKSKESLQSLLKDNYIKIQQTDRNYNKSQQNLQLLHRRPESKRQSSQIIFPISSLQSDIKKASNQKSKSIQFQLPNIEQRQQPSQQHQQQQLHPLTQQHQQHIPQSKSFQFIHTQSSFLK